MQLSKPKNSRTKQKFISSQKLFDTGTATIRLTTTFRDAIFQVDNAPIGCPGASVSVPVTTEGCWSPDPGEGPQTLQVMKISPTAIVIKVTGSNPDSGWQVTVPVGSGSLGAADLTGCN